MFYFAWKIFIVASLGSYRGVQLALLPFKVAQKYRRGGGGSTDHATAWFSMIQNAVKITLELDGTMMADRIKPYG
jgi:hypothetical protein